LRADGWTTVQGLEDTATPEDEARRLACEHILRGGEPAALA
jgi:hypothetical protein